jgi:hypothetical protein
LARVSKATVARLLRMAGRHAQRLHDQHVHGLRPRAVELDEQWSFVKKSKNAVSNMSVLRLATCETIRRWPQTASWWSLW